MKGLGLRLQGIGVHAASDKFGSRLLPSLLQAQLLPASYEPKAQEESWGPWKARV